MTEEPFYFFLTAFRQYGNEELTSHQPDVQITSVAKLPKTRCKKP